MSSRFSTLRSSMHAPSRKVEDRATFFTRWLCRSGFLEGGVAEDQALLADVLEGDGGLGVAAAAGHGDHDALAEAVVENRVSGRDLDRFVPRPLRPPLLALGLLHPQQVARDLREEPRRRVVRRLPEQRPTPRVREVEPLPGTCDADIREPPLLFELRGVAHRPEVWEHTVLHPYH